jgi:hypothetical protein
MPAFAYVCEVFTAGFEVDVELNRWPAYRTRVAERRVAQVKLNPWLCEGENHFCASLQHCRDVAAETSVGFEVRLYRTPHGQESDEANDVLVHYRWMPEESPLAAEGPTLVYEHTLRMKRAYGRFAWQDARPYDNRDRDDVVAAWTALREALQQRDLERSVALMAIKSEEMTRALDNPNGRQAALLRQTLESHFADPAWHLEPRDPDTLVLESSAGGRLLGVTTKDGSPSIMGQKTDLSVPMDVTFSHVAGAWRVVR